MLALNQSLFENHNAKKSSKIKQITLTLKNTNTLITYCDSKEFEFKNKIKKIIVFEKPA